MLPHKRKHKHTNTHTQTPATSRRRQILISRNVSELIRVASQTQTLTHTNTVYYHGLEQTKARQYSCMTAISVRRQILVSRIGSGLTGAASQTANTNTLPHTPIPATSRRRQILPSRTVSELSSVASQTQTQTPTHTQTRSIFAGLKRRKHVSTLALQPPLGEDKF